MNRKGAVTLSLATLVALSACATPGNQAAEPAAEQAAEVRPYGGADEFGRVMGGALVGATFGAGVTYLAVYSLGGPGLVSMIGSPIVTAGAVTGAVVGLAKAASHR